MINNSKIILSDLDKKNKVLTNLNDYDLFTKSIRASIWNEQLSNNVSKIKLEISNDINKLIKDNNESIVVPKHLVREVLKSYHEMPMMGHLSHHKTWHRIKNKFYWTNIR